MISKAFTYMYVRMYENAISKAKFHWNFWNIFLYFPSETSIAIRKNNADWEQCIGRLSDKWMVGSLYKIQWLIAFGPRNYYCTTRYHVSQLTEIILCHCFLFFRPYPKRYYFYSLWNHRLYVRYSSSKTSSTFSCILCFFFQYYSSSLSVLKNFFYFFGAIFNELNF